jgi:hypothetical protein
MFISGIIEKKTIPNSIGKVSTRYFSDNVSLPSGVHLSNALDRHAIAKSKD